MKFALAWCTMAAAITIGAGGARGSAGEDYFRQFPHNVQRDPVLHQIKRLPDRFHRHPRLTPYLMERLPHPQPGTDLWVGGLAFVGNIVERALFPVMRNRLGQSKPTNLFVFVDARKNGFYRLGEGRVFRSSRIVTQWEPSALDFVMVGVVNGRFLDHVGETESLRIGLDHWVPQLDVGIFFRDPHSSLTTIKAHFDNGEQRGFDQTWCYSEHTSGTFSV